MIVTTGLPLTESTTADHMTSTVGTSHGATTPFSDGTAATDAPSVNPTATSPTTAESKI